MSSSLRCLILSTFFLSITIPAFAQSGNPANNGAEPLNTQFQLMVDESNRYQQFKVIRSVWLAAFAENLSDSLAAETEVINGLQATIDDQSNTLAQREEEITQLNAQIEQLNQEKDGISFLGANLSKTAYNSIVWTLIAALLAGLLFFLGRGRYAQALAKDARTKNEQLTTDLEQARKRRLEVEQDLRRKLQDERNKHSK
ncbi:MAG: hypothetical protein AAF433_20350 [Bacteroidota bacterium]